MFTDPQTVWLNLTNAGLGLIVLAFFLAVGGVTLREIYTKVREAPRARIFERGRRRYRQESLGYGGEACPPEPAGSAD